MIDLASTLDTRGLDRLINRFMSELQAAIPQACAELKVLCVQKIAEEEAVDTLALLESPYISTYRFSDYEEACDKASEDYQFNPTKYPEIRKALGDHLKLDEEAKPDGPHEGYMAIAASHGKMVEEGYRSFYGNDIPARPFMAHTAQDGEALVVDEFRKALGRAIR